MAKKSFKKGVKNVINSIDTGKETASQPNKQADNKTQNKAVTPKPQADKIKLGERYPVQNAGELKKILDTALHSKQKISITSYEIKEINIAFIQLLIAFDNEARIQKLSVDYDINFSEDVQNMLNIIGMKDAMSAFTKQ